MARLGKISENEAKIQCAALAFHKSLIGISQLNALEEITKSTSVSKLSSAKALYTYYVVYHIFCMCILISPEKYTGKLNLSEPGEVAYEQINNKSERAEIWKKFKEYEADWATSIKHSTIKKFCDNLRKKNNRYQQYPKYLQLLYDNFIRESDADSKCIPGLFEKLNYIRDRVLYRPSFVQVNMLGLAYQNVQTSKDLGKEIASLPTSEQLYKIVSDIYRSLLKSEEYETLCLTIWSSLVETNVTDYCLEEKDINKLKKYVNIELRKNIILPSFMVHLLEIEDVDYIIKYNSKYWDPLKKEFFGSKD